MLYYGNLFNYKLNIECVLGLPFSCTKTDIENIFKPYGALKDVRVVTFRNGHSKGLAYVDFEDEVTCDISTISHIS